MAKSKHNLGWYIAKFFNFLMPWGSWSSTSSVLPSNVAQNLSNIDSSDNSVAFQAAKNLQSIHDNSNLTKFGYGLSDKFLGTNFLSEEAATTAFDRQKELQDRDFAFQQQMWQQTNQYNSPEAQMQRFRDAGLNPNLVTGNAPVAAQPMSGSSASAPMATGVNGAGDLMQFLKNLTTLPVQVDLMKAEAESLRASANKSNVEAADVQATREARIKQLYSLIDRNSAEVKDVVSKIEQRIHQNALTDAQKYNISFEQMLKQGYLALDSKRVANETNLTEAQVNKINAEIRESLARASVSERQYQEMVYTFAIRKAGLEKQNLLSDAQIAQAYATADKLKKEGLHIEQVMSINRPSELRSSSMSDSFESDNIFTALAGGTALMFDYLISKIGGVIIK